MGRFEKEMEKYFDDELLGRVFIRTNPRARRYIVKIDRGKVVGVMPKQGNEEELLAGVTGIHIKQQTEIEGEVGRSETTPVAG